MSMQVGKHQRKYKPTHFYSILSVGVVLFLFGIFGMLILSSQNLSNYFKENIEISIELKEKTTEAQKIQLETYLKQKESIKTVRFISKEQAAESMLANNYENFQDLLGYNPLYSSFRVNLKASYAQNDSVSELKNTLKSFQCVKHVQYDGDLIKDINITATNLGYVVLGIGVIVLLITLTLINSTVRLSMYSQRFLIKNMQLVGARAGFIIKPFLFKAFGNGLMSGLIASIGLLGTIHYVRAMDMEIELVLGMQQTLWVIGSIVLIGVLISTLATAVAVNKYIKMKLDELY